MHYTHYDYLELAPGASTARIEAAYALLLDRFGYGVSESGQDLGGLVRLIHAAYDTLANPARRAQYDATLQQEAALADAELKALLDQQAARASRRMQDAPMPETNALGALAA